MSEDVKKMSTAVFFSDDLTSSFVINDLLFFAGSFKKVILVTGNQAQLDLPGNVERCNISDDNYSTLSVLKTHFAGFIATACAELFSFPRYLLHPGIFMREASALLRSYHKAGLVRQRVLKLGEPLPVMISFWFNHWATTLAIMSRKDPQIHAYTRAHGIDLFEERIPIIRHIAFRRFQLKYLREIFSVSAAGSAYLKANYPAFKNKIFTARLGTTGHGTNPFLPGGVFTIVSCARIRNIKRIHLIPQILQRLNFPVRWIHIGGENDADPTLPELQANIAQLKEKKSDAEIMFLGNLSQSEVFQTYSTIPINLFISVSETEGLPVSMMESIGFGIPIMATDVGGCSEIVTEQTGILIPKEIDPLEVANKIAIFAQSHQNTVEFRRKVYAFCRTNFDYAENFTAVVNQIEKTNDK